MSNFLNTRSLIYISGCVAGALLTGTLLAQSAVLDSSIAVTSQINTRAVQSQTTVTNLSEETQDLLTQYRAVTREVDSLKIYNAQLEKVVADQEREVTSINNQLEGLEATNRGVIPLMLEKIDMLGRIVEQDVPFLIDARRNRVQTLSEMVDRADVTTSEKYRRVMEAYQAELEYGRTTEAYSGQLPESAGDNVVDFLRVGRTVLLYQSKDGEDTGWWNNKLRQYEPLGNEYRLDVKEGLEIANNQKAPDLVKLPVMAPEVAQ
jgi:hypothetical protein